MLTPDQIQQYRTQYGLDSSAPAKPTPSGAGPDLSGQLDSRIATIHAAASGKAPAKPGTTGPSAQHQADREAAARAQGPPLPENDPRLNVRQGIAANLP